MKLRPPALLLCLALPPLLGACDQIAQRLGLEDPASKEAKADAEGRAVGSACRQSGRAIEDCYSIYNWLPKASIFAGWRDMNDYMQANKLDVVEPKLPPPPAPGARKKKVAEVAEERKADSAAKPVGEAKADAEGDKKAEAKSEGKDAPKAADQEAAKAGSKTAGKQ
jgi:hypothetical protein